eukprot:TRINITY_DN73102_c0_g1_i1.p1 TRINITY_DN73102_c0_g1~~TRINITY_DN73102_c0_g1_i1.p1  ORF type:complete len:235 (-),score=72.75 TRINITY_DN73102_c0_g1_i1:464-1087(-)
MCNTMEGSLAKDLQDLEITKASPAAAEDVGDAVVEDGVKAEAASLELADTSTLADTSDKANTTATAIEKCQEVADDTKSGKPANDSTAAGRSQVSAAHIVLTDVTAAAETPSPQSLTVVFEQGGKLTDVKFEKRPLGFEVTEARKGGCCIAASSGKCAVGKVTNADLKAVKVGMVIKKIGDRDVPASKDLSDLKEMLTTAEKTLSEA